jgi:hypothetical protein
MVSLKNKNNSEICYRSGGLINLTFLRKTMSIKSDSSYRLGSVTTMIVLVSGLLIVMIPIAQAQTIVNSPYVFSPDSKPYGLTYGDWSVKWWQWIESIPKDHSPLSDSTGKDCAVNQTGPVWFLAGTSGGSAERSCTIPAGKAIFAPLINNECSYVEKKDLKTESELRACAIAGNNGATGLTATVDGVAIPNLNRLRIASPLFNLTFAPGNGAGLPPSSTQSVSDGFWILLHPLSPGIHEIKFGGAIVGFAEGTSNNFANDVTYHLMVQ